MDPNPIYNERPSDFYHEPAASMAQAIRKNDIGKMQLVAEEHPEIDLNAKGKRGVTLLHWALAHRRVPPIKKLLSQGADPNQLSTMQGEQFHMVAEAAGGATDGALQLFVENGGDPNGRSKDVPAIFWSIYARRFDRFEYLLKMGADKNVVDGEFKLPLLLFCAKLNLFEQVYSLLEKGADPDVKALSGKTIIYQLIKKRGALTEKQEVWRAKSEAFLKEQGYNFSE